MKNRASRVVRRAALAAGLVAFGFTAVADSLPPNAYIPSGLLYHWDGVDNQATGTHDPNAATWVDRVGKVALTKSGTVTVAASPEEEDIYSIKVTRGGKTVNEVSTSTFWLVGGEERKKITAALHPVGLIESETAKDFFTANGLYASGCYSEAYLLSRVLCDKEPKNILYLNLMKLCAKVLNLRIE